MNNQSSIHRIVAFARVFAPPAAAASLLALTVSLVGRAGGSVALSSLAASLAALWLTAALRRPRRLGRDPLTGLYTRGAFVERTDRLVAAGRPGAVVYLDLDRFGAINATRGRHGGDRMLVAVASALCRALPRHVVARVAGDEFAILLENGDVRHALETADRVRSEIAAGDASTGLGVYASVGVAPLRPATDAEQVLAEASVACREAKSRGRNRTQLYRPGLAEQAQRDADAIWSARLREALRDGRLQLFFQPIFEVASGQLHHYEVLTRIIDERGRPVRAAAFMATAERVGLIQEIDRLVIARSIWRIAEERSEGRRVALAVNLSPLSLHDDGIPTLVLREMARAGIDPSLLTFEITETASVSHIVQARHTIERLRERGCRFELDDFGRGFSSFSYLRHLPVDAVKIDGLFVRGLARDRVDQALVRSVNELAHALGLETIAESVEDGETLDALRGLGVDLAQGYHLGEPRPVLLGLPAEPVPLPLPRRSAPFDVALVLPSRSPADLIEFVGFLDHLERRFRQMRDHAGDHPADPRPWDLDETAERIIRAMRRQAEEGARAGASLIEIELPLDRRVLELVEWLRPRIGTFADLVRAGLVRPEWHRPARILVEMFEAVTTALDERRRRTG